MPVGNRRSRRTGGRAGEGEIAARILLREVVELLSAEITADGDVVAAAVILCGIGDAVGAVAIEGAFASVRLAMPLEKLSVGGPQSDGSWRLPVTPPRAIRWCGWRRMEPPGPQSTELEASVEIDLVVQAVLPIDVAVDSPSVSVVSTKAEEVGVIGADALEREGSVELVLVADGFIEADLHRVLMGVVEDRNLIVVLGVSSDVGQRVKLRRFCATGSTDR